MVPGKRRLESILNCSWPPSDGLSSIGRPTDFASISVPPKRTNENKRHGSLPQATLRLLRMQAIRITHGQHRAQSILENIGENKTNPSNLRKRGNAGSYDQWCDSATASTPACKQPGSPPSAPRTPLASHSWTSYPTKKKVCWTKLLHQLPLPFSIPLSPAQTVHQLG